MICRNWSPRAPIDSPVSATLPYASPSIVGMCRHRAPWCAMAHNHMRPELCWQVLVRTHSDGNCFPGRGCDARRGASALGVPLVFLLAADECNTINCEASRLEPKALHQPVASLRDNTATRRRVLHRRLSHPLRGPAYKRTRISSRIYALLVGAHLLASPPISSTLQEQQASSYSQVRQSQKR